MSRKDDYGLPGPQLQPRRPPRLESLQIVLEEDEPQSSNQPIIQSTTTNTTTTKAPPHHHHQGGVTDVTAYPHESVDNLVDSLRRLGFVGARRWLALGWPLEVVAEVVGEVEAAMEVVPGSVRNPAGLIRTQVRLACPALAAKEKGR